MEIDLAGSMPVEADGESKSFCKTNLQQVQSDQAPRCYSCDLRKPEA